MLAIGVSERDPQTRRILRLTVNLLGVKHRRLSFLGASSYEYMAILELLVHFEVVVTG